MILSYDYLGQQQVLPPRPSSQVIYSFQQPMSSTTLNPVCNPTPLRFISPQQMQPHGFYSSFPHMQQQQSHETMSQVRFQRLHSQQSNLASQPQLNITPLANAPTENKNWQDGLRALLPNINISFGSKLLLIFFCYILCLINLFFNYDHYNIVNAFKAKKE